MTFQVRIERPAVKSLSKIPASDRDRISGAIRGLADDPRPRGVKKLSGRNAWRIRVGAYRVLYEIHDSELVVLVISVGDRKDIYR